MELYLHSPDTFSWRVTGYGLNDSDSFPDRSADVSLRLCVQTGSWDPPSLLFSGYRE
jgi:hypothetical protein